MWPCSLRTQDSNCGQVIDWPLLYSTLQLILTRHVCQPKVPYAGLEIAIHAERARQAVDDLPSYGLQLLAAHMTLNEMNYKSAPRLPQVKKEE